MPKYLSISNVWKTSILETVHRDLGYTGSVRNLLLGKLGRKTIFPETLPDGRWFLMQLLRFIYG